MDNSLTLLFAAVLALCGSLLRQGKATSLLFGKNKSQYYNVETSTRFFSNLLFVLSSCNLLSWVGGKFSSVPLVLAGIILGTVALFCGLLYFLRNSKFRA